MINSLLFVCSVNILQNFVEKQYVTAINQQLWNIEINLQ